MEPTVRYDALEAFPLALKLVVLRNAEDVGIFVGPNLAVTDNVVSMIQC